METYDLVVIGGGIVGLATAWKILERYPGLKLAVVEKEDALATHQTDRNSGVIHSGIYYKPGSAKAINCARGYHMLLAFCAEHNIALEKCGKIISAVRDSELPVLSDIYERGIKNGLPEIRFADPGEVKEIEPFATSVRAIWVPQAGIIDYREVATKLAQLIVEKGGNIRTGFPVSRIATAKEMVTLYAKNQVLHAKHIIACAGLYADKTAQMAGLTPPFQIVPFRGEFYDLTPAATGYVRGLIYPVPDVNFPFLGVHLTKRMHGGVEAGPNAVLAFRREGYHRLDVHFGELAEIFQYAGFRRMAKQHWRKGMHEMQGSFSKSTFVSRVRQLVPALKSTDLHRGRSGVRAQALGKDGKLVDDYVILEEQRMIHLLNAPSPAATSCLSIGTHLADLFSKHLPDMD